MTDYLLIGGAIACVIIGFIGSVLPVIPGQPLAFVGLLLVQWSRWGGYSSELLWIMGIIMVVITVLDYILPAWFTKKFGGSKKATWGATIGTFVGLLFMPIGLILGPFLGAFIGEMMHDKTNDAKAWKVAFGSLLSFLAGTGLKLVYSGVCAYLVVKEIFV